MNATHDLDHLLCEFYRAETPDPWPTMRAPARTLPLRPRQAKPMWLKSLSRLAVAASIAALLVGYLALASLFPRDNGGRPGLQDAHPGTVGKGLPSQTNPPQSKPPIVPLEQLIFTPGAPEQPGPTIDRIPAEPRR